MEEHVANGVIIHNTSWRDYCMKVCLGGWDLGTYNTGKHFSCFNFIIFDLVIG